MFQTTAPNRRPIPAVTAIASAPQKTTRMIGASGLAFPALALAEGEWIAKRCLESAERTEQPEAWFILSIKAVFSTKRTEHPGAVFRFPLECSESYKTNYMPQVSAGVRWERWRLAGESVCRAPRSEVAASQSLVSSQTN